MTTTTFPTFFIPHGAGPCFFMDWQPAHTWTRMAAWLGGLEQHAGARPTAIVVVSAHWETPVFTVSSASRHDLLFDYHGFPEATYRITWPADGSPELAGRVRGLLASGGFASAAVDDRGLDHGVFIPLKVAFPEMRFPIVQLSLREDLDPAAHLAMGQVLAPLRKEGVLIVGTGMSYHNMRGFRLDGGPVDPESIRFDSWLTESVGMTGDERVRRLVDWATAPGARASHPREEHLLPLHVAAGAAEHEAGVRAFHDHVIGSAQSAFRFGSPAEHAPA
jgi:aromatic ring-opening dioxygenase catalytic subunit (LigB family)